MFIARFLIVILLFSSSSLVGFAQKAKSSKEVSNRPSPIETANKSEDKSTNSNAKADIQVYFGPKAADDHDGVLFNLLRFFDTAKTSIYGSAHEINLVVVAQKLAEKADAGVDVRVVVESKWLTLPKERAALEVLKKSKVRLIPDTKKSGLMHNKFFIVDKTRVWTGSTNLTENCLLFNYNNGIWIEDKKVSENFLTEYFEEQSGHFGAKRSERNNTPYPTVAIGSTKISTYFSPEDDPMLAVIELIARAKKSIDMMCFVFTSEDVSEAILAAQKRGVKIRVLLDNGFSSVGTTKRWKYVPFKEMKAAGIACKYDNEDAKLHHKVIVVDGQEVMTGSFNISNNAARSNDENMLIIANPEVAAKYDKEFERLWEFFNGDPGKDPELDDEDETVGGDSAPGASDPE